VDNGRRPGVTTSERERIRQLEREVRELRRANEILKAASLFCAAELDGNGRGREVRPGHQRALGDRADLQGAAAAAVEPLRD